MKTVIRKNDLRGSSPEQAIVVDGVDDEYVWLRENLPGFERTRQSLKTIDGKHYDILTVRAPTGEVRALYFDISGFFGFSDSGDD